MFSFLSVCIYRAYFSQFLFRYKFPTFTANFILHIVNKTINVPQITEEGIKGHNNFLKFKSILEIIPELCSGNLLNAEIEKKK